MLIFKEIRFDATHFLPKVPEGHACSHLHSHAFTIQIHVVGDIDPAAGWVMDFAALSQAVKPIIDQLDHHCLNEISGLENPTCEMLTRWIWTRLHPLIPGLTKLVLKETPDAGCVFQGEHC